MAFYSGPARPGQNPMWGATGGMPQPPAMILPAFGNIPGSMGNDPGWGNNGASSGPAFYQPPAQTLPARTAAPARPNFGAPPAPKPPTPAPRPAGINPAPPPAMGKSGNAMNSMALRQQANSLGSSGQITGAFNANPNSIRQQQSQQNANPANLVNPQQVARPANVSTMPAPMGAQPPKPPANPAPAQTPGAVPKTQPPVGASPQAVYNAAKQQPTPPMTPTQQAAVKNPGMQSANAGSTMVNGGQFAGTGLSPQQIYSLGTTGAVNMPAGAKQWGPAPAPAPKAAPNALGNMNASQQSALSGLRGNQGAMDEIFRLTGRRF